MKHSAKETKELMAYKIVRMYMNANVSNRIIARGLTLEEAQKHCKDPETSSTTCTKNTNKRRTKKYGSWFDGFMEE